MAESELTDALEQVLVDFVQTPNWSADAEPPEDNEEWRRGYEAAQVNLREALKPWWPFGGPLTLAKQASGK